MNSVALNADPTGLALLLMLPFVVVFGARRGRAVN
jgi:hypothetical protein